MPLYDNNYQVIEDPALWRQQQPRPGLQSSPNQRLTQEQVEDPGLFDVVASAFKMENIAGSTLNDRTFWMDPHEQDGYDAWEDIKGTEFERYEDRFLNVYNSKYAQVLKAQIKEEERNRRIIEQSGFLGFASSVAAGVLDPTIFLPGGVYVKGVRGAVSVGKTVAAGAALTATGVGIQESLLHATQQTRTAEESFYAIGTSAILGGMLGGLGAKILNGRQLAQLNQQYGDEILKTFDDLDVDDMEEAYDDVMGPLLQDAEAKRRTMAEATGLEGDEVIMEEAGEIPRTAISAGSAAAPTVKSTDIQFANQAQQKLSRFAIANNAMSMLRSEAGAVRDAALKLADYGFALKVTDIVRDAAEGSAEGRMKRWTQGAMSRGLTFTNTQFKAYRKSALAPGEKHMTYKAFNERVGQALRTEDIDELGNDFISKAAAHWRSQVFEPLKREAIDAGLLPKDVKVKTAASYFSRMYNVDKVRTHQGKFKGITRAWARRAFADQFQAQQFSAQEVDAAVNEIANSIYNKITGLRPDLSALMTVAPKTRGKRGPLEERTFTIPDRWIKFFLEDDVEIVARRYTRVLGADVEIARKFGDVQMSNYLGNDFKAGSIATEYDKLRGDVEADANLTAAQKDKRIRQLEDAEKKDRDDLAGLRDRLRGTYKLQENSGYFAPWRQSVMAYNYLRAMGGVVMSSLSDVARLIMVHGPGRFLSEGVVPLITNFKAIQMSARLAREMGAATETVLNTRHATWSELTDPYAYGNPVERWLSNATTGFSKLSGITYWNQMQKSISAVMSQNRILKNAEAVRQNGWNSLSKTEQRYMDFVGMSPLNAERLGEAFAEYGSKDGSLYLLDMQRFIEAKTAKTARGEGEAGARAYATKMSNYEAVRAAYETAVIKDVDGTIVTKGIADTPLALDGPVLKMMFQFKSFMLASHQRMLMRAVGQSDSNIAVMSGMMTMIGMGMLVYGLKGLETGRELSDNPGTWVAEGIDRSGLLSVMLELNNIAEKWGAPGFFKAMAAAFPESSQSPPASRYAVRSIAGGLAGPTAGLITDAFLVTSPAVKSLDWTNEDNFLSFDYTPGDVKAMRRITPGTTLPWFRAFVERWGVPTLEEAVE